jgi:cell division transport system permease protein
MGKLSFFFKEAFGSLRRNYFMTIAALVTVFLSIVVLGLVLVFVFTTNELLAGVEKKVEINVFFKTDPDPAPDDMIAFQTEITGWTDVVASCTFVSKEEGLEQMKEDFKDNPGIIENLTRNPLPNKLEVALADPLLVESVAARIEALDPERETLDEVRFGEDTAEKLFAFTSQARNIMVGFIVLLGIVAVLLISNTIRLSIFARRREVEIMKLVGATNWFIRWPFVIEGISVGLVGAAAAAATVLVANSYSVERLRDLMPFLGLPLDAVPTALVILVLLGVGVFIGAIGSALGLRRLLKI